MYITLCNVASEKMKIYIIKYAAWKCYIKQNFVFYLIVSMSTHDSNKR